MPIAVTLFYIALGVSWILFSDLAVERLVPSPADAARFQTYKGVLYVLLSAGVIYALLHVYHSRNRRSLAQNHSRLRRKRRSRRSHLNRCRLLNRKPRKMPRNYERCSAAGRKTRMK